MSRGFILSLLLSFFFANEAALATITFIPVTDPEFCYKTMSGVTDSHELVFVQGRSWFGPSMVDFKASYFIGMNFNDRSHAINEVKKVVKNLSDNYFSTLRTQRGFQESRVRMYEQVEKEIPLEKKEWLGIYDFGKKNFVGSIRLVIVTPEEEHLLAVAKITKRRGILFRASDLIKNDPTYPKGLKHFRELGRLFRSSNSDGEDAKKLWEIFFGAYETDDAADLIIGHTDTLGAIRFERDLALKVKRRIYKNKEGVWQMVDADSVKKDAPPEEETEYIIANSMQNIRMKIFDRILTDPSYIAFFHRYPHLLFYFEHNFAYGFDLMSVKDNPRYQNFFKEFFPDHQ